MDMSRKVAIYDCGPKWRGLVTEDYPLSYLYSFVKEHRGQATADKLVADLEATGEARIDGEFSWFEYRLAD